MSDLGNESGGAADWERRLSDIMRMMRETSEQTDPQAMVAAYSRHVRSMVPVDAFVSMSRRDLDPPKYRITRYSGWTEKINPWQQKDRLPILEGGLLGKLLYDGEPTIIDELKLPPDDPAAEYLAGQRSLMAVPHLEGGKTVNMFVSARTTPGAFDRERFPDMVWTSILFGRSTHNLVLAEQVRAAYNLVDRELQVVGDIQRSLLPAQLPEVPGLKLAAHYQTSQRAGGDYYDFFPLKDGRWGIMIADVSGHGTPAAVMMAVTHSIAHMFPGASAPPSEMLNFVGRHLANRYTNHVGAFVTAFYGIYDPRTRELEYSSAGHNPPRLKRCGGGPISVLDGAASFPLGIAADVSYENATIGLHSGDQIIFYTDGITEATDPWDQQFGVARLDAAIAPCRDDPKEVIAALLDSLSAFTAGQPITDDRTLVAAMVE